MASAQVLPGKVMHARYDGKCVNCGGYIVGAFEGYAGDMIRYDGKVHHADSSTCDKVRDDRIEAESDLLAERRNEAWFEERGGALFD